MSTLGPYRQSLPGWAASGSLASLSIIAWRSESLRLALAYPALTSKPAVWLISCRIVIGLVCGTSPFGVGHLEAGELGDVLGHRVVERPLALLPEHHHGHAHDRLGHRRDAEDRVAGDRLLGRQILNAVGVEVDDLAVSCDERRDAGELAVVHQRAHRPLKRLQPVGREADRLRGDKRIVRPQTVSVPPSSAITTSTSIDRRARACISALRLETNLSRVANLNTRSSSYLTRSQTTRQRSSGFAELRTRRSPSTS